MSLPKVLFGSAPWVKLPDPVDALENFHIARAQSMLTGFVPFADASPLGPVLPADQARDVLRWAGEL